jgi:hypothetical protein
MSRSGYSEDYDEQFPNAGAFYRSSITSATRGKRGQAFFRALVDALDAMPDKRLIADELATASGEFCAIGALGRVRGIKMDDLNPEDASRVAERFNIAECLAREVVFENDEGGGFYWRAEPEIPEHRWQRMRDWAAAQIVT